MEMAEAEGEYIVYRYMMHIIIIRYWTRTFHKCVTCKADVCTQLFWEVRQEEV